MGAKDVERRRSYFIDKKFQTEFILRFCVAVLISTLFTAILLYLLSKRSTTVLFENLSVVVRTTADFLLPVLVQTIIIATLLVSIATIIIMLFVSHRIAGPLYRLKKQMQRISSGELNSELNLRHKDELRDVANIFNDMSHSLKRSVGNLKSSWKDLKNELAARKPSGEEIKEKIEDVDKKIEHFKI